MLEEGGKFAEALAYYERLSELMELEDMPQG